ncbi:MAG TPA: hypothetical protein VI911_00955 [Patescibacteria group bacterium]|nr:hypothetical protein [Patescibacteria group bacterium]
MRPRKGSPAEKLGIKFTGNPDALDQPKRKVTYEILERPGKYTVGPLSDRVVMNDTWYVWYVDLDGVLCNFLKGASIATGKQLTSHAVWAANRNEYWEDIRKLGPNFWRNLEWLPEAEKLWTILKKFHTKILTAYPTVPQLQLDAIIGKADWIDVNLGSRFCWEAIICPVDSKQKYAGLNTILIDDNELTIKQWSAKGGIGILHNNVADTLEEIKKYANL